MTRDKRNCMRCGTGLCPRNEGWVRTIEPCDDCGYYIDRDGKTGEAEDERA